MSSITVNMENLNPNERELLTKLIEKANKPKAWTGPSGDWLIFGYGDITNDINRLTSTKNIYAHHETGHCGKTKEQAEFIRDKLTDYAWMLHAWLEIVGDWRPDWNCGDYKCYAYFHNKTGEVEITQCIYCEYVNHFYFQTEEDCRKWVDMVGDKAFKTEG